MMENNYVVVKPFSYMIECTCPRPDHSYVIDLHKGDILTITEEKRYVDSLGWLMLVLINDHSVYMFVDELEDFVEEGKIYSIVDLELQINYLEFKVNEMLDVMDKEKFEGFAKELVRLKSILDDVKVA